MNALNLATKGILGGAITYEIIGWKVVEKLNVIIDKKGDSVSNFYRGTTKNFQVEIDSGGDNPNITGDEVIFTMKRKKEDPNGSAVIQKYANVLSSGAEGIALFELDKVMTDIQARRYFYDIQWIRISQLGEEYILTDGALYIKERTSDA